MEVEQRSVQVGLAPVMGMSKRTSIKLYPYLRGKPFPLGGGVGRLCVEFRLPWVQAVGGWEITRGAQPTYMSYRKLPPMRRQANQLVGTLAVKAGATKNQVTPSSPQGLVSMCRLRSPPAETVLDYRICVDACVYKLCSLGFSCFCLFSSVTFSRSLYSNNNGDCFQ